MTLVKVDTENFADMLRLSLWENQRGFVASNGYSLSEAYAVSSEGRFVQPFGLYHEDVPVGFAMIGHNSFVGEDCPAAYFNSYYIWRFMIDRQYQKRGYGSQALELLLQYIRTFPDGREPSYCVSYEPSNLVAKKLYASFGFRPSGEMDEDEEIAVLPL